MRSDAINLMDEVFNKLKVIGRDADSGKWICKCECGNIRVVRGYDLRKGTARECLKCLNMNKRESKRNKIEGQQIGDWKVLRYIGNKQYLCKCKCGEEHKVYAGNLLSGKSSSCKKCSNTDKIIDLTNNRYDKLVVLGYNNETHKWICKCECGAEIEITTGNLTSGNSTQCTECAAKSRLIDITGKHYGEWEVIEYAGNLMWKCRCSCGKITNIHGYNLRNRHTTSCGHASLIDITGTKVNEWTVVKYMGDYKWLCRCSCGTERLIHGYELRSENAKSCGCKKWEYAKKSMLNKYGEVSPLKINKTREKWQIDIVENRERLRKFIEGLGYKPTSIGLSEELGIKVNSTLKYIHKYGLENLVDIMPSVSRQEKEILDFVNTMVSEVVQSDRKILHGRELDIYIPEKRLAIEFNGTYWHSDIFKERNYHQEKTIDCARQNIRLIHIFEYEWSDVIQQEKIKQLLANVLETNNKILYARNLVVDKLDNNEAAEFCNMYHLQNSTGALVKYGLFNNTELIGLMTFGKPRFNTNYEYELIRLAWKPNIHVVGGIEKLFKAFLKGYNPSSIITYCNIAKFTGNSYSKIGFKTTIEDVTEPNYVWVDAQENEILTRYQTQKQKLLDNGLGVYGDTEDEIMNNLGYYKIYDSGNLRLTWNSNK